VRQGPPCDVFEAAYFQSSHSLAGGSIPDLDRPLIVVSYGLQISIGTPSDFDNRWLELRETILFRSRTEQRPYNEKQQEKPPWRSKDGIHAHFLLTLLV
jgi:hypothetical protein